MALFSLGECEHKLARKSVEYEGVAARLRLFFSGRAEQLQKTDEKKINALCVSSHAIASAAHAYSSRQRPSDSLIVTAWQVPF